MQTIYTVEEIKEKITPALLDKGVTRVILFGSYSKGTATEDSDIDLVVAVEDWVDIFDFSALSIDVSTALGKRVDFLPLEDIIPGGRADQEIKTTGRLLYEKVG